MLRRTFRNYAKPVAAERNLHRVRTLSFAPRWAQPTADKMAAQEVLTLNQKLLSAIGAGDYATYQSLCDPSLTCFEPEAVGHLVEGLDFHKYYFTMPAPSAATDASKPHVLNTMASPHVRVIGDKCAVVSYIRLTQKLVGGAPTTVQAEETRVWEKKDSGWVHVHMHRSLIKM
ncbi:hypothetical protein Vretimale_17720 [Volvox reticuliferus]|uniref:Calcium/calmodulin-dependent protein kinase II association-domain domain-containing protein n=2 Tax=Volvox reticuliferus TaxID=1737510 RepID=A0A8J4GVQ1_9CHLO|nr:hypothetical protein Vretimale_17720 [Volvox reticuliferus]